MYCHPGINQMSYPNIHSKCFFVSCTNGSQINNLRDEIYDFALSMKPPGMCVSLRVKIKYNYSWSVIVGRPHSYNNTLTTYPD